MLVDPLAPFFLSYFDADLLQAAKDKSGKFSDNFNVTLFLVRPNDQTLQAEFSRSNLVCQVVIIALFAPKIPILLNITFSSHMGRGQKICH